MYETVSGIIACEATLKHMISADEAARQAAHRVHQARNVRTTYAPLADDWRKGYLVSADAWMTVAVARTYQPTRKG